MKLAWDSTKKTPITAEGVRWDLVPVVLPVAEHLKEAELRKTIADPNATNDARYSAAKHLTWLNRSREEDPILLACLSLNDARILHMPGELFVEYQLAAQKLRPDLFVAMAAYGDYAPGYIGTEIAYTQGGYETSQGASQVAPKWKKC